MQFELLIICFKQNMILVVIVVLAAAVVVAVAVVAVVAVAVAAVAAVVIDVAAGVVVVVVVLNLWSGIIFWGWKVKALGPVGEASAHMVAPHGGLGRYLGCEVKAWSPEIGRAHV